MAQFPNEWQYTLIMGYCYNPTTALYGTVCPCCALASAKSKFDGSDWCFNACCFSCSPCITRNYVRMGYEIDGRVGYSDCFCPTLCAPCVVTQLLNETTSRGPKIQSIKTAFESPWLAEKKEYSILGDPCDFFCTYATCPCEVANVYSQLSGTPFWFSLGINICQVQHLLRKSYGIGGSDCIDDCLRPTCMMALPLVNCVYFYKEVVSLRAEMATRGRAYNFTLDRPPLPDYSYSSTPVRNAITGSRSQV